MNTPLKPISAEAALLALCAGILLGMALVIVTVV